MISPNMARPISVAGAAQWYRARHRGERSGFDAGSQQPEHASNKRRQATTDPP